MYRHCDWLGQRALWLAGTGSTVIGWDREHCYWLGKGALWLAGTRERCDWLGQGALWLAGTGSVVIGWDRERCDWLGEGALWLAGTGSVVIFAVSTLYSTCSQLSKLWPGKMCYGFVTWNNKVIVYLHCQVVVDEWSCSFWFRSTVSACLACSNCI